MNSETLEQDQTDNNEAISSAAPTQNHATGNEPSNTATLRASPETSGNQRTLSRQRLTGRARVMTPGGTTQQAKAVDANVEGISLLMDLAIKPGGHYTLHITCFQHGRFLDTQVRAVCVHSTLCGLGFKTGFRFEGMPENVKSDFHNLLSQAAK